jgi:DNA-binding winged helix-turn-helix (wHTH) protein
LRGVDGNQGTLQFGVWFIEPRLSRITAGDSVTHLEPKAFEVLTYLLSRSGEIVSRQELIDHVWNGRVVEPGAVARNITQIRAALGDDARRPEYIETIPKRGYRTIAPVERTDQHHLPRIGIVALENLSTDPDYEHLAAGMTQDITALLGQIHRDQRVLRLQRPEQSERGDYVLTGSVRKFESRVRVAIQLRDPVTLSNFWSERYEREFADLFALQDDLVGDIVHAVGWATWRSVDSRLRHERSENLDVWSLLHQSQMIHFDRRADAQKKLSLVERALQLDPDHAYAHSTMAWSLIGLMNSQLSEDDAEDRKRALHHAATALSLAPDDPRVMNHCILVHRTVGDLNLARQLGERVSGLPGTDPHDYWGLLIVLGRAGEVVTAARKRWRNAIIHQTSCVSIACSVEGLHEEALETGLRAAANFPKALGAWIQVANAQGRLGYFADGRETLERVYARSPNWSIAHYEENMRRSWRHDSRLVEATTPGLRMLERSEV